ncbi:type II secretion system F family protein [bacterium]|nr:type II secretion system F family protein [bacterium]
MRGAIRTLQVLGRVAGGLLLLAAMAWGAGAGLIFVLFLLVVNGWAVYAFLRYRQGEQDELLAVLTATAEAGLPLPSGVEAFRADRRPGPLAPVSRWLSFAALPLYGYARIWLGWRPFDRLLADLSARLETGEPLSAALRDTPGVAAREVRLAAAVGEATGAVGPALRGADRERWSAAWLEVAPRLLYPLLVLLFVSALTTFLMVFIVPRFKKIFDEFGQPLPESTQHLVAAWEAVEDFLPLIAPGVVLLLTALAAVVANPTLRWHTPLLGRLYRWGVQAEVLRTLGRLLAVGQTVPQALAFLGESRDLPAVVRRRVAAAAAGVGRGDPLDASLRAARLRPAPMAPLVRASERVLRLPWALVELGDHLAGRAFRVVRRLSLVLSPLLVLAVGAVVAFIALAMFLPLVHLITSLSE